ncbi:MAG: hypothetical protein A2445_03390 [Candidatus Jacksonbacteria bacterium RIFOXYC2_FULL_44_29]|nr:MAG: hypothetical protein UW45_C0035G0015 [Parcubacteria group bacterium GW2011_GWC2_44_22]OGY76491.1 MAG: hypothetical protein A2240_04490 [Candidatus Jacksonbacteria bacterium RIFOXYA2_FULL_43_12]OGY77281.1 MAG: hypothetical protein A2295_04985 [Candidatus Jacksonbacteria bacterium RIFOXYB2_FULL_44_15]OGY78264.1 MAG: hypothetical protein A2445_03390 [Candidatus Jacksonbacteria bacterium RIFOXYC2_FULL_44_29]OGY78913.1 MAG: hypothetical protein A2550_05245 [Candidatus Jacksonbacteria bacteri
MITTEEVKAILAKEGDARGVVFLTDANYITLRGQGQILPQIEKQLADWDIPVKFSEIKAMNWYPVAWRMLSLVAIKEVLNWTDEDIRKMGENAPQVSVIVKLFFKLFPSVKKFAEQIPRYWRKHYTVGDMEVVSVDETNRQMLLHLKNFNFHPLLCKYYEGYFARATKLTRPVASVVTAKENDCHFKTGVPFHEYQLNWTL